MRRAVWLAPLIALALAGCGAGRSGKGRAQVVTCLRQREGLLSKPALSALVNPTGPMYGLDVSLTPGRPPSPAVPEAVIDMFHSSDQAADFVGPGQDRQGPAVITVTADAPRPQVNKVEACAF